MTDAKHYPLTPEHLRYEWIGAEDFREPISHLHPVLNYTKWTELWKAMHALPCEVSFRIKVLGAHWITDWDCDWHYHFRWGGYVTDNSGDNFVFVYDQSRKLYDVEWAELHFQPADEATVIAALAELSIPYEPSKNGVKVYGHIDDTGRLIVG